MNSRMRLSARWTLYAFFFLCPLAVASSAGAQDIATAEALFNKGLEDMKAGRHETGCTAIAESQRLDPRPGTLFTLATCEAEWGRIATAVTRYGDYLSVYERLPDNKKAAQIERYKVATAMRAKLLSEVPQLTLLLPPGAPAGTVVKRDGQLVAEAALGLALPMDPGEHTLSTRVPGGPVQEQRLTLGKGEKKSVTLEVRAGKAEPMAPPAVVEPISTGPSGWRLATYVVGGAGVAGLVVGGVMGGFAAAQKSVLDQHCGTAIGSADKTACDQAGFDASSSAKSAAMGGTIGLAIGGVALGTALVLFLTEPRATPPDTGAQGPGKRSRWVSAGVVAVGPAGALLVAQGTW